jgi:hypothetical protein
MITNVVQHRLQSQTSDWREEFVELLPAICGTPASPPAASVVKVVGWVQVCLGLVERALAGKRKPSFSPKPLKGGWKKAGEGQSEAERLMGYLAWGAGYARLHNGRQYGWISDLVVGHVARPDHRAGQTTPTGEHVLADDTWRLFWWDKFYPKHWSGRVEALIDEAYALHHWEASWKQ